jgi:exonuclease SbcC
MKFQKLTIHNIASIEDAVIDFEAQPLADSEVFLITGNTGAGKSTILDAICLALYASTPRLSSTKMQGEIKDGDRDVTLKDPRQLMRRNTGEAFVTLAFTGSNGIPYEATWSVARARKKATGNIQSKDWQLKNLSTNSILEKDTEIKDEIAKAIGLDFNQFCRTTMLAQGEFTILAYSPAGITNVRRYVTTIKINMITIAVTKDFALMSNPFLAVCFSVISVFFVIPVFLI